MQSNTKYKPGRSMESDRRMARDKNSPRNYHSYEVNKSWRKFRHSLRKLGLKGSSAEVIDKWLDSYSSSVFMPYTD